jgi:hypothetical protein
MLRAYILGHQGSWDQNLPWAEFSYKNSYQESLKMAPFEVLYGRRCRTLLNWIEPGEKVIFGLDIIEEAKAIVCRIQDNLKAAKSRQETYANKRCRPMEFKVGDLMWDCGLQAWPDSIFGWSSRHLPRVTIKEVFKATHGRRVA